MKVAITIPIYHSSDLLLDFTKQTLESIKSENNDIYIYLINNFSKPEFYPKEEMFQLNRAVGDVGGVRDFRVIDNPKGNEVGAAWNLGIKTGLEAGCDFAIVMNNDLVLHYKCIDNLVAFADTHPEFLLWTASEWIDIRTIGGIKELEHSWSALTN